MKIILFTLGTIVCLFGRTLAGTCDLGWVPFNDEKCFKLTDQFVTHDDANALCLQFIRSGSASSSIVDEPAIPQLITIKSEEEQDFLTKYIFQDSQVVDNVWLGAKRQEPPGGGNESEFFWDDGSPMDYTNWHEGHPIDLPGNDCAQMVPKGVKSQVDLGSRQKNLDALEDGYWTDTSCVKRNLAVCQTLQMWSLLDLQKAILETRKEVKENPGIPLGFIYVQLPNQPDAGTTWPTLGWDDVTAKYAGLFFRVEGGESAPFEEIQEDSTRQIVAADHSDGTEDLSCGLNPAIVHKTGWSDSIRVGHYSPPGFEKADTCFRLQVSDTEVRPRNSAVRVWKRVR